jgi:hypothetical protein
VALDVAVSNMNPDGFVSPSVLVSYGSGGPIPSGSRKPLSGQSVITNVTLMMRSFMSEMTSNAMTGTVIKPSCL